MAKIHATRTFAPLQFEALEPTRFEDLVRGLLHDFKDWQKIEATGRGGSDEGFDARAFERKVVEERVEEDSETTEEPTTVEGNLWMIQCKRQKNLTAAGITKIIKDGVVKDSPPYGYILAAPVNFTKKSYDAFRAALIEHGVTEFHLWGRAELEDMLFQPKNDGLLFAFFGISLVSKKRSKVTDIRKVVNIKNKLIKIFGDPDKDFYVNVLVRDTNDSHYPREEKYPDFKKSPHWKEYAAYAHHVEGVRLHIRESFGYLDKDKKEWDYVPTTNLIHRQVEDEDDAQRAARQDTHEKILDYWEHLQLARQSKFKVDGLILYRDIDFIDKEGDTEYKMPHLYVGYVGGDPFEGFWNFLTRPDGKGFVPIDGHKRIKLFPEKFPAIKFGKTYQDKQLDIPSYLSYRLRDGQHNFFDFEKKYNFLKQRDMISIPNPDSRNTDKWYAEVMYIGSGKVSDLVKTDPQYDSEIEQQIQRKALPDEEVRVLQIKRVYDFQVERRQNRPKL